MDHATTTDQPPQPGSGELLGRYLAARGRRKASLARAIGVQRATVQGWLRRGVPADRLGAVANELPLTPEETQALYAAAGVALPVALVGGAHAPPV